jgi:Tol biopolymer transport system component/DNA-binding winged helix-turn-helix (wHTH) protein
MKGTALDKTVGSAQVVRFATFEVDLQTGELHKAGLKLKFGGQPFQVLAILLEQPGTIVTRRELQNRLWPDSFVDVEHNLNTAINKIREALGDSAENPRFIETLPKRGYRFMVPTELSPQLALQNAHPVTRTLVRLTFDAGLQLGVTWSPDSRFVAYSSDRGGKFDIWVQPVGGGNAVQVTKGPDHNWQPDWSPDGKLIAFRSERHGGGLYLVPALGGPERRIASFGYRPRWSPNGSQVLFGTSFSVALTGVRLNRFYLLTVDGNPPREVLTELLSRHDLRPLSAAWHPDGKRISVGIWGCGPAPSFWTAPLDGGAAIKSAIAPGSTNEPAEGGQGGFCTSCDAEFSWAPSGQSIYFQRRSGGALNLWKMALNPADLQPQGIERLTTGAVPETDFALSPDGKKLAFTAKIQYTRVWVFPFDATSGRVTGPGQAVTSPGMVASQACLSPDGSRLAFCAERADNWELREKSFADECEAPVVADCYIRSSPVWSPDGRHLAYIRANSKDWHAQVFLWSVESRNEEPLTGTENKLGCVYDWSPDGRYLLASGRTSSEGQGIGIWLVPTSAAPQAEMKARQLAYDSGYALYQAHFSPDGRWIVFEATKNGRSQPESNLCVMPATGGPWIPITAGKCWHDKPRWSPDGRTIYFLSGHSEFFNVCGIRFNPVQGCSVGEPFCVTSFESPGLRVSEPISLAELSVTRDRLALSLTEASGSIWMLDNVDR